jgi:hypothetical protein
MPAVYRRRKHPHIASPRLSGFTLTALWGWVTCLFTLGGEDPLLGTLAHFITYSEAIVGDAATFTGAYTRPGAHSSVVTRWQVIRSPYRQPAYSSHCAVRADHLIFKDLQSTNLRDILAVAIRWEYFYEIRL